MADESIKIFYSWQSWTPRVRNQEFIEESLSQAIKQIKQATGLPIVIDSDTRGLPGIPAIAESIFKKIEDCDIFFADITPVLEDPTRVSEKDKHKTPNPNVILELGYAIRCLGWERIILVMNKAYGEPDELPFDFRHRRWPIAYKLES